MAELLIMDMNRIATKANHGFPQDRPPAPSSANGNQSEYADGYIYARIEVRSMPTVQRMGLQMQICQYAVDGSGPYYYIENCGSRPIFDGPGTSGTPVVKLTYWSIPGMWKMEGRPVDWSRPRSAHSTVVWAQSSGGAIYNMSDYNIPNNPIWAGENPDDWFPMDFRYTAVLVRKGEVFSGWQNYGFGTPTVARPTFNPPGGTYTGSVTVAILCATTGAAIKYTTDGSTPTAASSSYSQLLTFTQTTTLKALGIKSGMDNSPIATAIYTIAVDNTPPVISSVTASGDPNKVKVVFNEAVDQTTTQATANYAINNGITVSNAALGGDKKTVTLTTSALTEGVTYTLTANNVKDLSGNSMVSSMKTFQYVTGWTDDFSDGNYTANQAWTVGGGSWSVTNGALQNTATGKTSIWAGEAAWGDYTYTADVTPISGTNTGDTWMIFRVQDANNFYLFTMYGGKGSLWKFVGGSFTILADGNGAVTFSNNQTYNMKVEVAGNSIKVYANNTLVASATDNTFTKGYVGFGSDNAQGEFDNVSVILPTWIQSRPLWGKGEGPVVAIAAGELSLNIILDLAREGYINLEIVSVKGEVIAPLLSGILPAGKHEVTWDTRHIPNGIYCYFLHNGKEYETRQLVLIK
jgi:hypothetical protein